MREHGKPEDAKGRISLRRVPLDRGGYDRRGAYWGLGAPLYIADDEEGWYVGYARARSRAEAADKLGLPPRKLKASRKRDERNARRAVSHKRYSRALGYQFQPGDTFDSVRRRAIYHTKTKRRR